jgi:hypothetical protein
MIAAGDPPCPGRNRTNDEGVSLDPGYSEQSLSVADDRAGMDEL